MRFRVLGPLEVEDVAEDTALRRRKPRALLALLLLNANRVVSRDELVIGLWGDEAPASAQGALQNYVSLLRKALRGDVLLTREPGYVLRVEPGELDLDVFKRLVAEAADAEPAIKVARLTAALSLWRGAAFAEFDEEIFASAKRELETQRFEAETDRLAALLELGRANELVGELESLAEKYPLDERIVGLLMLALYRAGRQADALTAYERARRYLRDELGLQPGEELQELQHLILNQDESLGGQRRRERVEQGPTRKPVTALVATVAPRDPRIDPEALRTVLRDVEPALREAVRTHGGMCAAFSSGELTAFFGVPAAHEDDALRAVRTAAAIRAVVARINSRVDPARSVSIRAGIEHGDAVVETNANGPVITTAALSEARRLHEHAADGELLVGPGAAVLVRGHVALERVDRAGDHDTFVVTEIGEPGRRHGFDAPLVGRRAELARIEDELARAVAERTCRVVTVVGDPGIGKSRLVVEVAARAKNDVRVLWARCAAYGEGASFLPLAQIVREHAHELEPDVEGTTIATRLGGVTGLTDAPVPTGDAFWAVRRFFERLAASTPVLLVVEDAHWAEPTFLDLVDYLRDWTRDAPLAIVATARPELLELRPAWGATALVVGPLPRSDIRALARNLGTDPNVGERVVDAAEGNPLFAEQLAAELAEGNVDVPPSLEALLASRLDVLAAGERAVVQRAAVLGREFTRDALLHLTPPLARRTLDARIGALVRKGFLHRARTTDGFTFHHALARDAAYTSAPKELRAALHEQAAEWLGEDGPDELVGFHFEAAYRYLVEVGTLERADVLSQAGGERLAAAGIRAFGRADLRAATALLRRALNLLPEGSPKRLEAMCELAAALRIADDPDGSMTTSGKAEAEAERFGERRQVIRARIERAFVELFLEPENVERAVEVARAAIDELDPLADHRALGRAWVLRGLAEGGFMLANAAWVDAVEHALFHYRQAGFPPAEPIGHFGAAVLYGPTPVKIALRRAHELLGDGDGGRNGGATLTVAVAGLEAFRGNFAEARMLLDGATATLVELGQTGNIASWCDPTRGEVERLANELPAAERALRTACEALERLGSDAHLATRAPEYARVLYALGRVDDAEMWTRKAEERAGPLDLGARFTAGAVRGILLARAGSFEQGEQAGREAVALADRTDALHQRAQVRLDLAETLRLGSRIDAAAAVIAEASRLFGAKGSTAGVELAARATARLTS